MTQIPAPPPFWWMQPPYPFWVVLTLPAIAELAAAALVPGLGLYTRNTGLISCWLLILSLMITPLGLMFGPRPWVLWLRARRRYIGVASFFYAVMHVAIFIKGYPQDFWPSFGNFDFQTGWIGLAVMAVMAWTSRDISIRRMGRNWKRVQMLIYPASIPILYHWWILPKHTWEVVGSILPLVVLTIWRLFLRKRRVGAEPGAGE